MHTGAITGYIDVAQLTLYVFWMFFFGLIFTCGGGQAGRLSAGIDRGSQVPSRASRPLPRAKNVPPGRMVTPDRRRELELPQPRIQAVAGLARRADRSQRQSDVVRVGPALIHRSDDTGYAAAGRRPKIVPLRIATDTWSTRRTPIHGA